MTGFNEKSPALHPSLCQTDGQEDRGNRHTGIISAQTQYISLGGVTMNILYL